MRVSEIARAERDLRGRYTLTLRSHPETIRTSRPYAGLFRSMYSDPGAPDASSA